MNLSALWGRRNGSPRRVLDSLVFLECESPEAYRARDDEHLSPDQLNDFRKDPFVFHKRRTGVLPEETGCNRHVERAALVLILEGRQEYERQFVTGGPVDPSTGEPYREFSAKYREWAESQDRTVLTVDEAQVVEHVEYGVRMHLEARTLLANGMAQGVVRCEYRDVPCHSRTDWVSADQGLVGLAVCERLPWFETTLRHGDVLRRLGFEHALVEAVTGADLPVHVVAVEKQSPHRCGVWFINERLVQKTRAEIDEAIDRFRECREQNYWPTGYETVRILAPTAF